MATVAASIVLSAGGLATGSTSFGPTVRVIGNEQSVFDQYSQHCPSYTLPRVTGSDGPAVKDMPDQPARAFRTANGKETLIASNRVTRRIVGPDLNLVKRRCKLALVSPYLGNNASSYAMRTWLSSPYTPDGEHVYALLHTEYHGDSNLPATIDNCPSQTKRLCWYDAITMASSKPVSRRNLGVTAQGPVYSTYLKRYVAVDSGAGRDAAGNVVQGVYFATSPDLRHWTKRRLLWRQQVFNDWQPGDSNPIGYALLIDPRSRSRNFDTGGRRPFLYFVRDQWSGGDRSNRNVHRIQIEFDSKRTARAGRTDAAPSPKARCAEPCFGRSCRAPLRICSPRRWAFRCSRLTSARRRQPPAALRGRAPSQSRFSRANGSPSAERGRGLRGASSAAQLTMITPLKPWTVHR